MSNASITDERAMELLWLWSIETSFDYPKLNWRDDLTPAERAFVKKLDEGSKKPL